MIGGVIEMGRTGSKNEVKAQTIGDNCTMGAEGANKVVFIAENKRW